MRGAKEDALSSTVAWASAGWAGSFVREGGNENRAQGLGRQSGLPDAPSTAPKLTHHDHASPGSQKVCVISDSKFKAHDINLSSDLYVEQILQTKGNRKGEFANTCQYIRTHTQKAWCLFICVNVPCVCTHVHMGRPDEAVRCRLLLSASFLRNRSLVNLELTIFWLE